MSVFGTPNYRTFMGSRGIIAGSGPQGPGMLDTIQSIQMSVFAADSVDFGDDGCMIGYQLGFADSRRDRRDLNTVRQL